MTARGKRQDARLARRQAEALVLATDLARKFRDDAYVQLDDGSAYVLFDGAAGLLWTATGLGALDPGVPEGADGDTRRVEKADLPENWGIQGGTFAACPL